MLTRRWFLTALSSVPFLGNIRPLAGGLNERDFFSELGVRPIINAAGTSTALTGNLMLPEAIRAWEYATRKFVNLDELHDAIGQKIASLVGSEAALVSAGAASALTLGTAACMTGLNQDFIRQLPDTWGMKDEVIIQKSHRFSYDHAVRNCGVRMIEIETAEELAEAVNSRTAMMLFLNVGEPRGQISAAEFARLGKKHSTPTFIDCAADVPPVDNLFKFLKMGYDLATFSGGKAMRGPQSTGLLLGRKDLIAAARLNGLPHANTIGRGMKVNKEEMLAMMVALESYLQRDHGDDWRKWERQVESIARRVEKVPGVHATRFVPEIANRSPQLHIGWDQDKIKINRDKVLEALRTGAPPIEARPWEEKELEVLVWTLQPGEAEIVGERIAQLLT
jgi:uncharacterized pyridoxal phosphate-dependent enzyme